MRKFYTIILTVISSYSYQITNAQCTGVKGPNLIGAKGTFSSPAITINPHASNCSESGSSTYSTVGTVGDALPGCTTAMGNSFTCSDFAYNASKGCLQPAFSKLIF